MITIKTDSSGNIQIKDGRFVLIDGKEAMVQECWHRAFLFQGDDMFNADRGIPLANSLRGSFQTKDLLTSQIEAQVEDSDEVLEASVDIEKEKDTFNFNINVNTIYGSMKI